AARVLRDEVVLDGLGRVVAGVGRAAPAGGRGADVLHGDEQGGHSGQGVQLRKLLEGRRPFAAGDDERFVSQRGWRAERRRNAGVICVTDGQGGGAIRVAVAAARGELAGAAGADFPGLAAGGAAIAGGRGRSAGTVRARVG